MPEPRRIVPDKGIRPGRNSSGADIAAKVAVQLVPAGTQDPNQIRLPNAAGERIYGLTMGLIKNGQIGDIQTEGRGIILAGAGGLAVDQKVAVTTAGAGVNAATATHNIIGTCVAAAAAGDYAEIELVSASTGGVVP